MMLAKLANDTFRLPSVYITPFTREGYEFELVAAAPASATYVAVNRAFYYRIIIPAAVTIYKFFWLNGATASTNNFQVGLYYDDGTNQPGGAVVRGTSTTASGANICQYDNITDTTIGAGIYWLAIWGSGTTATLFRRSGSATAVAGCYLESSLASGLPATATPASAAGVGAIHYVFGMMCRASP
jgi:hypothetical protein